ncbi:carbohydrate-binding module family 1 protein [Cadophora sp. DSE1049]|nr:carbohydrate-binding module family 1 protein [Cadophora sp. DSE1049]
MKYAFALSALTAVASGHSIFQQIVAGGTEYGVGVGIRKPSYNGPITDVTSNDIACNGGPNPTTPSSQIINVVAGATVKAKWRHSDAMVIDASHKGPVMAYLKKVDNALTDTGIGGGWFKIEEAGYNPSTGTWAVDDLIAADGYQSIRIPSCLPNGQYLLRAELIALHGAGSPAGAQFYMECAQINVSGGSGTASPATVSLPGTYSASDPGILLSIYYPPLTSYTIPGPRPFVCGSGGSQPTTATTTQRTTTTLATSTRTTSAAAVTTSASTGTGAALYGQCGGIGWTGPKTCAQGRCVANGDYYSQCIP